jgi:hypothetical protein
MPDWSSEHGSGEPTISDDRIVLKPASDIIARRLGDSAVLIRLQTNRIYELNDTGARIWEVLKTGVTRDDVVERLLPEFEIDRNALGQAVDELLGMLKAEGLI